MATRKVLRLAAGIACLFAAVRCLPATTVTLSSAPNPSVFGAPVVLTATLAPGTATGRVTFYDGVTVLGTSSVVSGVATLSTILLPSGTRSLRAYYAGDAVNSPAGSNSTNQRVDAIPGHAWIPGAASDRIGENFIALGDFNGDGKLDFVTAGAGGSGALTVRLGNGDGTFQPSRGYDTPNTTDDVVVADLNGDGDPDIIVSIGGSNTITVHLGNGDGTFQAGVNYTVANYPLKLVVADFNGDGIPDLAVSNFAAQSISILLGRGDGTLGNAAAYPVNGYALSIAAGDFNRDGKPDLAVGTDAGIRILLGNGDGSFQAPLSFPTFPTSSDCLFIAAGDLNGDGKADLVVANFPNDINVFMGNGDGTFSTPVPYPAGREPVGLALGDLNGDGIPDLAVANNRDTASIFLGNGDGTFQPARNFTLGQYPQSVAIGDFNGDGIADLAIADGTTPVRFLFGISKLWIGLTHSGSFTAGQSATYTITVENGTASATSGTITVTETLPAGLILVSMAGTGWNCTGVQCTRNDVLGSGLAYPPIIVTVNVAVDSPSQVTNQVSVSGAGDPASAADLTMILHPPAAPILSSPLKGATAVTLFPTLTWSAAAGATGFYEIDIATSLSAMASGIYVLYGGTPGTSFPNVPYLLPGTTYYWRVKATNPDGETPSDTWSFTTAGASLGIAKTHAGIFTQGQNGATYTVVVTNTSPAGSTSGAVTVTESLPTGLSLVSMSGSGWTCQGTAANNCTRSDALAGGTSYAPITVTVNVAPNASSQLLNQVSVSGGGSPTATTTDPTTILAAGALRFIPITPCRLADTRKTNLGVFGAPSIAGGASRDFIISNSACSIPAAAQAFSFNVAVVPQGALGFLTLYPAGQARPVASTLNSLDGRTKANAAIAPAGTGGAISVFASNTTDVVLDINGYFVSATNASALAFYPVTPCRVADTRKATGYPVGLGSPSLTGAVSRTFPIQSSACNLPSTAQAYSLNFTAVPPGALGFVTAYPTGQTRPQASNINDVTATVVANAVIVPAGTSGSIDVFASNNTDLVIDVNGYFAPPGTGGLSLYGVTPCRVLDTRKPPISSMIATMDVNLTTNGCALPGTAQAYVVNATVVPQQQTGLGFLTLWPQGQTRPTVSTLNAIDGATTSNMAIVPTTNGSISVFGSNPTHVVMDVLGYFGQ